MLQDELSILRELAAQLDPSSFSAKVNERDGWQTGLEGECLRLKQLWTAVVFNELKDKVLERYIQFHQAALVDLCDQVSSYVPVADTGIGMAQYREFTGHFLHAVFDLLGFIERYFTRFFNLDARIPAAYFSLSLAELEPLMVEVSDLLHRAALHAELVSCIEYYILSFKRDQRDIRLSYRELMYLKEFLSELRSALTGGGAGSADLVIARKLIYLNFNQLQFFAYCQDMIRREADEPDMNEHQQAVYLRYLTALKATQTKPGFYYHPLWPALKTMLEKWLEDEVHACEILIRRDLSDGAAKPARIEKVPLDLSVAQLACLLKLLVEERVVPGMNISDLLRFVAAHYTTRRQQHISAGSLSKEFYSVSQVTAATVRDLLLRMTSRVNKNFFPVIAAVCLSAGFLS